MKTTKVSSSNVKSHHRITQSKINPNMFNVKRVVFNFAGLSDESKKKALEKFRDYYNEHYAQDDFDMFVDDQKSILKEEGIDLNGLYFDIYHGTIAFDGWLDLITFLKHNPKLAEQFKELKNEDISGFKIKSDSHGESFHVEELQYELSSEKANKMAQDMSEEIDNILHNKAREVLKDARQLDSDILSDENLIDFMDNNEIKFNPDGSMYR